MKYKAIIFDLDGTLLNTLEDLADSVNAVLQQNGFPVHDLEKYKYFVGDGIANLVPRGSCGDFEPEPNCSKTAPNCYWKNLCNCSIY